jgi:subtilisin-like proprotein convertase family protein
VEEDETVYVFSGGPFSDDTRVALEYFPLDTGVLTLAWSTILWQENAAYYTYVSAEGGELLWRKNIANEADATYVVYDAPSPAPLSPSALPPPYPGSGIQGAQIARSTLVVNSELSPTTPWLPDGPSVVTTGNNVDAGLDVASPNGIDTGGRPTSTVGRVFDFPYNPAPGLPPPGESPTLANYRAGEVTDMFFWSNRYHDQVYKLGFTEGARNFQTNNFGLGGLGNDAVRAEAQDSSGTSNANFFTPPDGQLPRMQMYIFDGPNPDRTSALDHQVLLHELTHGTSNRLHANAAGLNNTMSGGMGEGWSDFYAFALMDDSSSNGKGIYATGGWVTKDITAPTPFDANYFYGIRRFPHAVMSTVGPNGKPLNPLTFADIDPAQINLTDGAFPRGPIGVASAFAVHNIGEVWCAALMEVRARMIGRLGFAVGNNRVLQVVTDGMKLDPVNPTLLDGRNAMLAANFASGDSAGELDIWRGFAARGMGFSASAVSSASGTVVEAFDLPNLAIGNVSVVSDSCDNGGTSDPGETVVLSVPFTNPFQLTDIHNVVATIDGSSYSLGTVPAGATVTQNVTVTIPSSAVCGASFNLAVQLTSEFGSVTRTVVLPVGFPTGTVPAGTFASGNVVVPIPDFVSGVPGIAEVAIPVDGTGLVGNVKVSVRLNHTFDGDLQISLIAPSGKAVVLAERRGGSGDNFGSGATDCSGTPTVFDDSATTAISAGVAPFAGSFRPDTPLSGFKGTTMAGTWRLRVTDQAGLDVGTVYCVTLQFIEQLYFCCGVDGTPMIAAAPPATLVAECASATNGAPDPGEVVTMSFPMRNVGSGSTTNLIATLLNSGGITPISGPQSYGAFSPVQPPVSRNFEFAVSSALTCGANAVATFSLQDGPLDLGAVSFNIRTGAVVANTYAFSNSASITIPATGTGATTGAPSNPYPSPIVVSGVAGTVVSMSMKLTGFSHTFPSDVDMLLEGPGGQKYVPFSDAGGTASVTNLSVTLADNAATAVPTALTSGTFRPTNSGTGDAFPAPAPAAPYQNAATAGAATFASVFGGANPNGSWKLYVVDDAGLDIGSISGGWSLTFNTADPVCLTVNTPGVSDVSVDKPALWPPNHQMQDVAVNYTVTDCASCTLSVSSNEAIEGNGDGNTSPDWEILGSRNVRLRAERSALGTGRIYTITIICLNGAGVTTRTVPVHVAHNIGSPKAGAAFIVNSAVNFAGTFWDAAGKSHTARWLFDTLSVNGTVVEPSGQKLGTVTGSYVFNEPGVYAVTMNITDNAGNTAAISNSGDVESLVVVYDPNGGYIIGGGWFDSPAGALKSAPATTGKVSYGFNSKYKNGANPKGDATLVFTNGDLRFEAFNYSYLAISGSRAQFAGTGKINGGGATNDFILTVTDGGVGGQDFIRMKITQKNGTVIYDSGLGASDASNPTTAVGEGSSVVIQK